MLLSDPYNPVHLSHVHMTKMYMYYLLIQLTCSFHLPSVAPVLSRKCILVRCPVLNRMDAICCIAYLGRLLWVDVMKPVSMAVHLCVHQKFFDLNKIYVGIGWRMLHDVVPYDPIQGHEGRKVVNRANLEVCFLQYACIITKLMVIYDTVLQDSVNIFPARFFIFIIIWCHMTVKFPPSSNLQMMISLDRVFWSTLCFIPGCSFQGWRIFNRVYFRLQQITHGYWPSSAKFQMEQVVQSTSCLVLE